MEWIKNFKTIIATIITVGGLIGGVWAAEDRYLKKMDAQILQQSVEKYFLEEQIEKYEEIIIEIQDLKDLDLANEVDKRKLNRAKTKLETLRSKLKD